MVATKKYTYGLGRRKSATATARLYKGKGEITINDKSALEYLSGNKTYLAEQAEESGRPGKTGIIYRTRKIQSQEAHLH